MGEDGVQVSVWWMAEPCIDQFPVSHFHFLAFGRFSAPCWPRTILKHARPRCTRPFIKITAQFSVPRQMAQNLSFSWAENYWPSAVGQDCTVHKQDWSLPAAVSPHQRSCRTSALVDTFTVALRFHLCCTTPECNVLPAITARHTCLPYMHVSTYKGITITVTGIYIVCLATYYHIYTKL